MRPSFALFALAALAGCAAPAAPAIAPPPPAVVEPPPPPPLAVLPPPEVLEVEPVEPPPVPGMRIDGRSVFERAGAVEWTLANGLTVVYVHDADAEGYHARVVAPGNLSAVPPDPTVLANLAPLRWGALLATAADGERLATGSSASLGSLVDDVARLFGGPPDSGRNQTAESLFPVVDDVMVFLLGARERSWVEPVVARDLGALRPSRASSRVTARDPSGVSIPGGWEDLPAVRVLGHALAERAGGGAGLAFDGSRLRLTPDGAMPRPVLLARFSDDELRQARDRAAARAASPEGQLETFAALYAVRGDFRPARDPAEAATLPSRIARTPPAAVADLLRRLSDAR